MPASLSISNALLSFMPSTYAPQPERDMANIVEVMKYKKEIKDEEVPLYITILPPSRLALALKVLIDRGLVVTRTENNSLTYILSDNQKPGEPRSSIF
jgi:hypothetical protein